MILVDRNAASAGGHHSEYLATIESVLSQDKRPVQRTARGLDKIFSKDPIVFMMIEESPLDFFLSALIRAFLRRRTVGLLFRAGECVSPTSLRLRAKRAALVFLRRFSDCAVVTILPFSVERRFERIAKYGIYDLQLWDWLEISQSRPQISGDLTAAIDRAVAGRKVVVALGTQNSEKGFDYFAGPGVRRATRNCAASSCSYRGGACTLRVAIPRAISNARAAYLSTAL